MAFRELDARFPSLTFHCLVFYWVVCLTTLGITIGSVVQQVGVYRADCQTGSYYTNGDDIYYGYGDDDAASGCIPGDIAVFALGLGVAVVGMIQSSLQVFLFYHHHISPFLLFVFNAIVMVLWIIVIAIGWNPTSWSTDPITGNATPDISGWLYNYSGYWAQNSVGSGIGPTLALAMGFAVMSIISFGLTTLLALYAFVVYHRNWRRRHRADKEALVTAPKMTDKTSSGSVQQAVAAAVSPLQNTVPPDYARSNLAFSGTVGDRPTSSRSV